MKDTAERLTLTKKLALTGAFSALIIVLGITKIGFISIGAASITILHIPVILTVLLAGLPEGIFAGAVFGILSLIMAAMTPSGILDPMFVNPLCSVLPRILFAAAAWILWKLLNLIPKMAKILSGSVAAAFGTFANTFFVMGAIYILYGRELMEGMGGALSKMGFDVASLSGLKGYFAILACTMASNGIWEIVGAVVITVAVLSSLYLFKKGKSKLNKSGGAK